MGDRSLEGRVIVVTGAGRDLGLSVKRVKLTSA